MNFLLKYSCFLSENTRKTSKTHFNMNTFGIEPDTPPPIQAQDDLPLPLHQQDQPAPCTPLRKDRDVTFWVRTPGTGDGRLGLRDQPRAVRVVAPGARRVGGMPRLANIHALWPSFQIARRCPTEINKYIYIFVFFSGFRRF